MLDELIESIVTTTSLAFTIPNLSRAASSIVFGSFVSLRISTCREALAPRTKSISETSLSRWPADDRNSARERAITVAQIPLVASKTVARTAHDGKCRKPLIAGTSTSRAAAAFGKEEIDWASGPLLGRLLSHSVVPILCKNHLRFRVRTSNRVRNLVGRCYADWLMLLKRRKPLGLPAMLRKRRRCNDTRRDASFRLAAIRELVIFARIIISFISESVLSFARVRHNIKGTDITNLQHLLTTPNCLSQRYLP